MKRTRIDKEMVSDCRVLVRAAVTAAYGKRHRQDVVRFFSDFDANISRLRDDILSGVAPYNRFRCFTIYDPKERIITAVSFEDRVVHHALMGCVAPVLEKAMIPHTYACRPGKGPIAAVKEGDMISIDIPNNSINIELSEDEINRRLAGLPEFTPRIKTGYLARYIEKVTSASTGAVFSR